jgi:hypothetical protein
MDKKGELEYRSKSERIIAEILKKNKIVFKYEMKISIIEEINNKKMERLWYPDFYLEEYGIIIEFIGKPEDKEYMNGFEKKKLVYRQNGLKVIYIYPHQIWEINKNAFKLKKEFEYALLLNIARMI